MTHPRTTTVPPTHVYLIAGGLCAAIVLWAVVLILGAI